jgi:hypothetical protein
VRVEDGAHHGIRAEFAAHAFVVVEVRLHDADAQRGLGHGRERGQTIRTVAEQRSGDRERERQWTQGRAQARTTQVRDRDRERFVTQNEQKRQTRSPADIGELAHRLRWKQAVAERVAEQFRH